MRVVLDTVVFVRALINPQGRWGRIAFQLSDSYTTVVSPNIVREVTEVIYRSSIVRKLPPLEAVARMEAVLAVLNEAEVVTPTERLAVCRDPNDDKFFECAVASGADYIISEDQDILAITEYQGVKTVSALEFLLLFSDA